MTGSHRGERHSLWQVVGSVAAALVGRGYAGRHRAPDALLRPTRNRSAAARPAATAGTAVPRPTAAAVARAATPARPVVPRLTLVPAGTSPFAPHRA